MRTAAARETRRAVTSSLQSGGPPAGFAFGKGLGGACGRHAPGWRGARAARVSPDDVRIRQAVAASLLRFTGFRLTRCSSGFPEPRPGRRALRKLVARFPARSFSLSLCCLYVIVQVKPLERDRRDGAELRHRPGPLSNPPLRLWDDAVHQAAADCEVVPVADWTVSPLRATKSASGATLVPASSRRLPHVTANTRRPSPRLDRHVSAPSGDGSARMIA